MKASLLRPAHQKIKTLVKEHGMTQQELLGRLISWFASQSKERRVAILAGLPERKPRAKKTS